MVKYFSNTEYLKEQTGDNWRTIPNFESYQIDMIGNVWSKIGKGKFLKPSLDKDGYLYVVLKQHSSEWESKSYIRKYIHQLVLLAWIGPCPIGLECRHKDNDIINNNISNLEYSSHKVNMRDRYANGTYKNYNNYKLDEEKVKDIKTLLKVVIL